MLRGRIVRFLFFLFVCLVLLLFSCSYAFIVRANRLTTTRISRTNGIILIFLSALVFVACECVRLTMSLVHLSGGRERKGKQQNKNIYSCQIASNKEKEQRISTTKQNIKSNI